MNGARLWQSRARWLPWLVAIVAGAAAALLASRWLGARVASAEAALAGRYAEQAVIVAARSLGAGQALQHEDLAQRQVPARYVPSDALPPESLPDVLGRVTQHALAAGDPLLRSSLQAAGEPALASLVGPHRRAITLAVDDINGFAGLLAPGDLVDILYLPDAAGAAQHAPAVRPLLEAVSVIATGRSTRRVRAAGDDGVERELDIAYATVALDLAAADAQRLVLAQHTGEVTVLLRGPGGEPEPPLRVLDLPALLGTPTRAAARGVQLIVGGAMARATRTRLAPPADDRS